MTPESPSGESSQTWRPLALCLGILIPGFCVIAALMVWAVSVPGGSPAAVAPAAAAQVAAPIDDMPGMTGMGSTATTSAATTAAHPAATTVPAAEAVAHKPYDAALPPVGAGTVHRYTITLEDETLEIAPGVRYAGWTFDGGAPGPIIHVRQGDWVDVTLVNGGAIPHSIDFHAALTAPQVSFKSIPRGGRLHFRFRAETPGVFMYHCGTPPVLAHIANGMYGAIVVDPGEGHAAGREELRPGLGRVVPHGRRP